MNAKTLYYMGLHAKAVKLEDMFVLIVYIEKKLNKLYLKHTILYLYSKISVELLKKHYIEHVIYF